MDYVILAPMRRAVFERISLDERIPGVAGLRPIVHASDVKTGHLIPAGGAACPRKEIQ